MAMLGRYRRRIATASMCALVTHPSSGPAVVQPLVADVGQVVRLCSLGLQVCGCVLVCARASVCVHLNVFVCVCVCMYV
jgi:hypothetical protein